jgi:hypothetical protein
MVERKTKVEIDNERTNERRKEINWLMEQEQVEKYSSTAVRSGTHKIPQLALELTAPVY